MPFISAHPPILALIRSKFHQSPWEQHSTYLKHRALTFNCLVCMDFAKFMSILHKLRPSSCFILNHKSVLVDPGSSYRLSEPYTTLHSLDFQNEGPSHPYFKLQKVSLPHLSSFTKKCGCNISFDEFEILQILKSIRTYLKPF